MTRQTSSRRTGWRIAATGLLTSALVASLGLPALAETAPVVEVGPTWRDVDGAVVEAHGGAANLINEATIGLDINGDGDTVDDIYFLYGEKKTNATRPVDGINGYWSEDLVTWNYMGNVLRTHQVLPNKVITTTGTEGLVDVDLVAPAAGTRFAVLDEDNLGELKRLANLTEAEAAAEGKTALAANSRAFVEAYVEEWDGDVAVAYDDASLELAFQVLYGQYNIVERPKVIYNEATGQFVAIYHADSPSYRNTANNDWINACRATANYQATTTCDVLDPNLKWSTASRYARAELGFAVSDSPFGPFKLVNTTRANFDPSHHANPGMARDMTVFVDQGKDVNGDGSFDAYAVYSSEENARMYISLLNADYTDTVVRYNEVGASSTTWRPRVLPDQHREASSVFFWDGWYYMLTSGTNGWASTGVVTYRARDMLQQGAWERVGNPFIGAQASNGYNSQPTYVLVKDQDAGEFIYMGDRWIVDSRTNSAGGDSRLIWLPIRLNSGTTLPFEIEGQASWNPLDSGQYRTVAVTPPVSVSAAEGDAEGLRSALPQSVTVRIGGTQDLVTASVTWNDDSIFAASQTSGTKTVRGQLTFPAAFDRFTGRDVSATVTVTRDSSSIDVAVGYWPRGGDLPETVTIGGAEVPVSWDERSVALASTAGALASTTIIGTASGEGADTRVRAAVTVLPENLVYLIDSGRVGLASDVYTAADRVSSLLNESADQRWDGVAAGPTWGYSTRSTVAYNAATASGWEASYHGANYNQPVEYHLTLDAGIYEVAGFQAARPNNTTALSTSVAVNGQTVSELTASAPNVQTEVKHRIVVDEDGSIVRLSFGTNGTSGVNARLALVYVNQVLPLTLELVSAPIADEYEIGDELQLDGLDLVVRYSDGTSRPVPASEATVSGFDSTTPGSQVVTVSFVEFGETVQASFTVVVNAARLESLAVTPPTRVAYTVGDDIQLDGFVATAIYSDESTVDVTDDVTLTGFDSSTPGDRTVLVTYADGGDERTSSFDVTVSAAEVPGDGGGDGDGDGGTGGSNPGTADPTQVSSLSGTGLGESWMLLLALAGALMLLGAGFAASTARRERANGSR